MIQVFQNYHLITGLFGLFLVFGSVLVWLSGWSDAVRHSMEEMFIPGRYLFDPRASYTGTVTFFRWAAWFLGALLFCPTVVGIDIGLAAITFFFWRYLARQAQAALTKR